MPDHIDHMAGMLSRSMEHVEQTMRSMAQWELDQDNQELSKVAQQNTFTAGRLALTTKPYGQALVGMTGVVARWLANQDGIDAEAAMDEMFKDAHERIAKSVAVYRSVEAKEPMAEPISSVEELLKREIEGDADGEDA